jgi:hypothetical protein
MGYGVRELKDREGFLEGLLSRALSLTKDPRLLVKLRWSADVGRAPVWACPCRGPVLDQRLPAFRRGAPRAATGGRA